MSTILITGGSEGIGFELAKCFAGDGNTVVLCARDMTKLEHAKNEIAAQFNTQVDLIAMDLSKQGAAECLFKEVQRRHIHVDILVNNAGIGFAGSALEQSTEKDEALILLNDVSAVNLMKLFGKKMAQVHRGEIINIGSTGAFQPGPYIASYYASKSFLVSYSRALAYELKESGVRVYCYCPGPVNTAFYEKSGAKATIGAISPQKAAHYLYTHRKNKVVIVPGVLNNIMRVVPSGIKVHILAQMKKKNIK